MDNPDTSRMYPGLDVTGPSDTDLILAAADDWSPTAAEERDGGLRLFFSTAADRDAAVAGIVAALPAVSCVAIDVPDERWAERSQAALTRICVGRVTVAPPWDHPHDDSIVITILPSMGFGTGHHASTRLCLTLLQQIPVVGARVCDVGTGSGVLAIAALRLGAAAVSAVDYDMDSIVCARESADLNGITSGLTITQLDVDRASVDGAPFGLVLANLTGGLLMRLATRLVDMTAVGGHLVLSGITTAEGDAVRSAFSVAGVDVVSQLDEDGWVGLLLRRSTSVRAPEGP